MFYFKEIFLNSRGKPSLFTRLPVSGAPHSLASPCPSGVTSLSLSDSAPRAGEAGGPRPGSLPLRGFQLAGFAPTPPSGHPAPSRTASSREAGHHPPLHSPASGVSAPVSSRLVRCGFQQLGRGVLPCARPTCLPSFPRLRERTLPHIWQNFRHDCFPSSPASLCPCFWGPDGAC